MKQRLRTVVPAPIFHFARTSRDRARLRRLGRVECDTSRLIAGFGPADLRAIFASPELAREWAEVEREIGEFGIAEAAGGVNTGDRRAIYYLLRHFGARSVLEVGTHIGASTVHAVAAIRQTRRDDPTLGGTLVSVDIADVNDPTTKPWRRWGSTSAPREMAELMGAGDWVTFVTRPSLEYLATTERRFDVVFLDGDHAAGTVYRELPAALRVLNDGGVVLLHDYYPRLKRLWAEDELIEGPWLATERLRSLGGGIRVLPLGELPWPTKCNSHATSLALVVREDRAGATRAGGPGTA